MRARMIPLLLLLGAGCGLVQPPPMPEDPIDIEDCVQICADKNVHEANTTSRKEHSTHLSHNANHRSLECICEPHQNPAPPELK